MKVILIFLVLLSFTSCVQQNADIQRLQVKVDSMQTRLNDTYKPGLGEFMMGIQMHHAKLWFAGINKNWALADFEIHEIGETLDDIKKYCSDRPEVKSIAMIDPAIKRIADAIQHKDAALFRAGFTELTGDCNGCHKDNKHEFNVISVPTSLPVTNQKF